MSGDTPDLTRLAEALAGIDLHDGIMALVPDAVKTVNDRRRVWLDNEALDDTLNKALGVVTIVAEWAVNGALLGRDESEDDADMSGAEDYAYKVTARLSGSLDGTVWLSGKCTLTGSEARALAARLVELADEADRPRPIQPPEGCVEVEDRNGTCHWRSSSGLWSGYTFDALVRRYGPVRPRTLVSTPTVTYGEPIEATP